MKFRKFASWSPTKKHRERRQAEKEKKKQASAATVLRNSSEISTKPSMTEKGGKNATKGDVVIVSTTVTDTGVLSKLDGDRPTTSSFLFEDNEEDDINGSNPANKNNSNIKNKNTIPISIPKLEPTATATATPLTPIADLDLDAAPLKKNLFQMPQEIMIDPLTVPPSPMREPNVNAMSSPGMNKRLLDDYHPGMYLNFQDPSSSPAAGLHQPQHQHCLGDPVGDIAMQRQLMDAQRLVRIILGKPLHKDKDQQQQHNNNQQQQVILGANSILQAIRSYALMKAELMDLRKKQELADGDPPAILLALGSPAATTPSTTRTGLGSPRRPGVVPTAIHTNANANANAASDSMCGSTEEFRSDADLDALPTTSALDRANQTIERLQKDLTTANGIILELQDEMEGVEKDCRKRNTTNEIILVGESKQDGNLKPNEQQMKADADADGTKSMSERNEDAEQPIQNDEQQHDQTTGEESKQDGGLDLLLDEIVLIPQRVLTKDMVREKLELYYHNFGRQSSENQILQMKNEMRQSQEASDRRIQEMETKLKAQHQEHEKQIQAIIMEKEQIVDTTKTEKNENTILIELSHNTTSNTGGHLASSIRKHMADNSIKVTTEES